jgi:hypothetical protein
MKTDDWDLMHDSLKDFIAIEGKPERILLTNIEEIPNIPDRV